jgi:uncharacterized protein (UPF0335 family)
MNRSEMSPRQRLVYHVQELERLEELKKLAAADLKEGFDAARGDGYDLATLKIVLKLRKMTSDQRREQRALEAIYLASLGMLEGDPLTDEARRRLDSPEPPPPPDSADHDRDASATTPPPPPERPTPTPLPLKDPEEARQEGAAAAAAGKRVYDNPYRAGDPCRAAWDEGWCAQQKSHGMETPSAYQRRSTKPPDKNEDDKDGAAGGSGDLKKGAA